jgi:hypothetical protein
MRVARPAVQGNHQAGPAAWSDGPILLMYQVPLRFSIVSV